MAWVTELTSIFRTKPHLHDTRQMRDEHKKFRNNISTIHTQLRLKLWCQLYKATSHMRGGTNWRRTQICHPSTRIEKFYSRHDTFLNSMDIFLSRWQCFRISTFVIVTPLPLWSSVWNTDRIFWKLLRRNNFGSLSYAKTCSIIKLVDQFSNYVLLTQKSTSNLLRLLTKLNLWSTFPIKWISMTRKKLAVLLNYSSILVCILITGVLHKSELTRLTGDWKHHKSLGHVNRYHRSTAGFRTYSEQIIWLCAA